MANDYSAIEIYTVTQNKIKDCMKIPNLFRIHLILATIYLVPAMYEHWRFSLILTTEFYVCMHMFLCKVLCEN